MTSDATGAGRQPTDQDVELIGSAMRLVAAGASTRTTVAGIHLTDAALAIAVASAVALGVRVETIRRPDGTGDDVVVTRIATRR